MPELSSSGAQLPAYRKERLDAPTESRLVWLLELYDIPAQNESRVWELNYGSLYASSLFI
ncbi:hypothetical protein KTT_48950 [Tengunoibacter tsumagoiensis]|uniref:Uncharacterized protein n=1 Tax=Tengunoibacter tsumagoiensis TaxID=2014871 RepID=A0A402A7R0_9CHLR|nr:hypothetical protein KTT_48950 [Tengunoibacter tsumagoiensis]